MQEVLSVNSISKSYPGVQALREVSLSLASGEIRAVCGENGAGKSTLVKILMGIVQPDSGSIAINGEIHGVRTPQHAQALGLGVVAQELSLAPHLSIAENIGLGAYASRSGLVDYGALATAVAEIGEELGLVESPDTPVGRPSAADRSSRSPRRSTSSRAFSSSTSRRLRSPRLMWRCL